MRRSTCLPHLLAGIFAVLALMAVPAQDAAAQAGSPGLVITAEPGKVPIGGTFRLVLTYTLPAGAKTGRAPDIRGIEALSVVKREVSDKRIVLSVMGDSLDPIRIGPVELGYTGSDGQKGCLRSGVLTVGVTSNMKGAEELRPIKGIIPTRSPWVKWTVIAGITLLILAVLAGAVYAWKRWRRVGTAVVPADPPHVRAEKEIEALLKENLSGQGRTKEFYFRFTEIVKRYLEALRGFPAAEYTTEEISGRILDADRPVLAILRSADLVKFADGEATPGRVDDDVSAFLAYIDVTAPGLADKGAEPGEGGQ